MLAAMRAPPRSWFWSLTLVLAACVRAGAGDAAGSFRLVFDPAVTPQPYTGRVYVVLSDGDGNGEPRRRMTSWGDGPQILSLDVSNVAPGSAVMIGAGDAKVLAAPADAKDIKAHRYTVQAVARNSPDSPSPGSGPGDLYSVAVEADFDPLAASVVELKLTKVVAERPFKESDRIKLVELVSPLLSKFEGRPVTIRAGVYLPEGWKDDPSQRYSVVYSVTGFGGDHQSVRWISRMLPTDGTAANIIMVVPDATCFRGHSVFADSANNGPRGESLMTELIPEVERRFHGAGPSRRYVTGVSSGGWSSLWLQVTYPDQFAGCWSHCPDPVDFRDFQQIDLYAPGANMYRDPAGQRRPLGRQGDAVWLWYDSFVKCETALGPGGQIHSFEAVFSPRSESGEPRPLFDRSTGAVDPVTAKAWERYDIRLVLQRNWATLGPKLKGKLHIYAGGADNFYLDGAVAKLKLTLAELGSDAVCEVIPGMPHTLHQPGWTDMFQRIAADAGRN